MPVLDPYRDRPDRRLSAEPHQDRLPCGCSRDGNRVALCAPHAWQKWCELFNEAAALRSAAARAGLLLVIALLSPIGAIGQEGPAADGSAAAPAAEAEASPPPAQPSPLVAAGWCAVHHGAPDDDAPACDVGLGVSLFRSQRWPRLAAVGAVGAETVGVGVAWVVSRPGDRAIAVSVGVVAPYDEDGIDVGRWAVALGATFGIGGHS